MTEVEMMVRQSLSVSSVVDAGDTTVDNAQLRSMLTEPPCTLVEL